jgi:nicotinamide riboside transporter PnuC
MELLSPGFGLLIEEILAGCAIVCVVIAWLIIAIDKNLTTNKKLFWLAITLFLPIVGPILFLLSYNKSKQ